MLFFMGGFKFKLALKYTIVTLLKLIFCLVKDENVGLGDSNLEFPETDFKAEDIKLDPNCDFGPGQL